MGLHYFQISTAIYQTLLEDIQQHENELVGPRSRGYWMDRPDEYDYVGVRETAQRLVSAGHEHALAALEISEVQAHSLSLLDIQFPPDDLDFAPALFLSSGAPDQLKPYMAVAYGRLGTSPEKAARLLGANERDERFSGYVKKQVRLLRGILPAVWRFHEQAIAEHRAILVVDLRARDLEIPEEIELGAVYP